MLKTVIFWLEFALSFWKNVVDQTSKAFNTKFGPQSKDRESSYRVRQILAHFCILVALILGWNCLKDFRITKIVKQTKFKGVPFGKLRCNFYIPCLLLIITLLSTCGKKKIFSSITMSQNIMNIVVDSIKGVFGNQLSFYYGDISQK